MNFTVEVSEDRFTTRMPLEEAAFLFNLIPVEVEDLAIGREIRVHRVATLRRVESELVDELKQITETGRLRIGND